MLGLFTPSNDAEVDGLGASLTGQHVRRGRDLLPRWLVVRLVTLFKTINPMIDRFELWNRKAIHDSEVILMKDKCDLIFVSCPPFSTLKVAETLSEKFKLPWVADFRDLFSGNHAYDLPGWRQKIDVWRERRIVQGASALITVSEPLGVRLRDLHSHPIWIVKNGSNIQKFELKKSESITAINADSDVLVLAYTGTIYYDYYSWRDLLVCMRMLRDAGVDLKLILAGQNTNFFLKTASDFGLREIIFCKGLVSSEDARRIQQEADCLIFFTWKNAEGFAPQIS